MAREEVLYDIRDECVGGDGGDRFKGLDTIDHIFL